MCHLWINEHYFILGGGRKGGVGVIKFTHIKMIRVLFDFNLIRLTFIDIWIELMILTPKNKIIDIIRQEQPMRVLWKISKFDL